VKGQRTTLVTLALMLVCFGIPLVWRLRVEAADGLILAPAWERRVLALSILLPLIPATALIVAAVRRALRLWVVLPLVGLLLLGVVGGGALMTVLTHNFLFPDRFLRTEALEPEELHLYDSSFLGCTVKVYAAPPGALYARLVKSQNIECAKKDVVHARWNGSEVEVYGGGVPSSTGFPFLGPH
jgi:hypothetical protein